MQNISDVDRDSLHILPLCIVPLETAALKTTRMIKNSHLESVIELFEGKDIGSGQVGIDSLSKIFSDIARSDFDMLKKLSALHSYDVYSLRILLRQEGIEVEDGELKLSPAKQGELAAFMRRFTRPLIVQVYGDNHEIKSFQDAFAMFSQPNVRQARENLQLMASKMGIVLEELPKFLQDFGDIFLSIAYYRQCLAQIEPTIADFASSVREIREHQRCQANRVLMETCNRLEATVERFRTVVNTRFTGFDREAKDMWLDVNAERFRRFRALVAGNHTTLGGILCTLSVKMSAWSQKFPNREAGGPLMRADYIVSEMRRGMESKAQSTASETRWMN